MPYTKTVIKDQEGIELIIYDIHDLPEGKALETPLYPKRRRLWQPSSCKPEPPFSPPKLKSEISSSSSQTPSPVPKSSSVHTLSKFVECEEPPRNKTPSPKKTLLQKARHRLNKVTNKHINYGSETESDSDDDDEDESVIYPLQLPRAIQSLLDTPLDEDTADKDVSTDPIDTAPAEVPIMMTEQPWGPHHFDWRTFPNPPISPASRRETFSVTNVGPTTPRTDPYEIFLEIWDRQIMEQIVTETNKYAQQVASELLDNQKLSPRSRIGQWRDTTVEELYVYFGLVLAMGIVVKSRLVEYWAATCDIFYTPGFGAHMPLDRFILLNRCLHFNNNENMCAQELNCSEAKLFKIQPILSHLNKKFQEMYTPAQNISLDESLLMWKGWLKFNQVIPNKIAERGIKTYEVCESQTGYLWRFEVHTGSKKTQPRGDALDASTPSTVLQLLQGLEHKGYTVWMDNFYNSPCLARRLKSLGFDCVGTLRTDRLHVPQSLHSLTKQNMHPGQIAGFTSGDVDVMVWRDLNKVGMISTYHGNAQQTARGSTKPILILDYNIMMGGVDKKDQLLAMYPVERKRTSVWYKKFFRRLLNISVLNAHIIHRHTSKLDHRSFRKELVTKLLSKNSRPHPIVPIINNKVDVTHRIDEYPMGKHQRMRRACAVCKKQVHTYCIGCNKPVCIADCFVTIHSM